MTESNLNKHLNLFHFFNSNETQYYENNLSRALALTLKSDHVFLDRILEWVLPQDLYKKSFKADNSESKLVIDIQKSINDFESFEIDGWVFYEDLRNWLKAGAINSNRSKFKIALLERAIQKAKLGYQFVEDEKASQFWINYWHLVNEVAPILNMPRPEKKPSGSSFVYFYPPNLPSRLSLIHKFTYGNVDIQISNTASRTGIIRESVSKVITDRFTIQQAGKSAVIRRKVPVLDLNKSVEYQSEKAQKCIHEVKNTYEWLLDNDEIFHQLIEKWE